MANRRMISKSICTSEQVNSLPIECELLFTWMVTIADDDGRLKGSAASVRGNVFPMKDYSVEQVEEMLLLIEKAGLIWRWADENGTYIEFPKWLAHQEIRKDRYHPSKLPSYQSYVNQMDTSGIPSDNHSDTQDNTVEESRVEGNVIENTLRERESEGKPPLNPNTHSLSGIAEHQAKRAWSLFNDSPDVFVSRYLSVARAGVKWSTIYAITNEINKDDSIQNKGEEFEKRTQAYLPKNKISTEKE